MKHFKHFALTVLVALVSNLSSSAYNFEVDGLYYNKLTDLTCEVTYKDGYFNSYSGNVVIPSTVYNEGTTYTVTSIGEKAFLYCEDLTSVVIASTITEIGNQAFACSSLESVNIPNSVTEIETDAFIGCSSLQSFTGKFASDDHRCLIVDGCLKSFAPAGLPSYSIPLSVTEISDFTFFQCTELVSVIIPNSVTSIGQRSFEGCKNLTTVNIPNSVTKIASDAFCGCISLPVENGIRYADTFLYSATDKTQNTYKIKEGTKWIGWGAFSDCSNLTTIEIPNSICMIGDYAFSNCTNLESIKVKKSIPIDLTDVGNPFVNVNRSCVLYVPTGSKELYSTVNWWYYFTNIQEFDFDIDVTISDALPYTRTSNENYITVNYTRDFENKSWQPLYIPFSMKYEEWADKADVAYINNVHQWDDDKDGEIDRTMLEFITKKSGAIEANKPYVIRPKQTGDVTFTSKNVTLYAAPETDGFVDCMSTTTKYTLYGTYQEKTDMYKNGYYAMSDGDFLQAENSSVTLAPFRIYMKIESRTGNGSVQNAPKKVKIMVDGIVDGEATGLEGIIAGHGDSSERYNLAGQKVSAGYKGIVIKNGRKYLMK